MVLLKERHGFSVPLIKRVCVCVCVYVRHYALLVKAWETKVFPTIRRRFRNEAERKSGLDQIKGALQLGEQERPAWSVSL